jgi:hypothetical protein
MGRFDGGFHRHPVWLPAGFSRQGLVAKISAEKDLAGPSYSGDFPGLGRNAQDFGYFEKAYPPGMTGDAWDPNAPHDKSETPLPVIPAGAAHAGLTARLENFARTIGAQIFGKW